MVMCRASSPAPDSLADSVAAATANTTAGMSCGVESTPLIPLIEAVSRQ